MYKMYKMYKIYKIHIFLVKYSDLEKHKED